jgi:2'-hydroxyisoflavone reductase
VFDDCGYFPRHVSASAEALAPAVKSYVYVSSISCYARNDVEGRDETAELATMPDPTLETMGANYEYYGALKALCEAAAEAAVPGRTAVVRPGYIVGPGDPTGRFTYWPARAQRGGTMLVPGRPSDPVQVIDVRDLADFMLRVAERGVTGRFNACGPAERLAWGRLIDAACDLASARPTPRWANAEELAGLGPVEFPIWAPYEGETKGFHTWSNARAVAAGLRFKAIEDTTADTLAWWQALPEGDRGKALAGPDAEAEADLLEQLG